MNEQYLTQQWRVGRKVGRTIYTQSGQDATDEDPLIGVMDTPALAAGAVEAHNRHLQAQEPNHA